MINQRLGIFDRLASVQEQRLPVGETPIVDDGPRSADIQTANKVSDS